MTMNNSNRTNPHTTLHRRSSSAPEVVLETRAQEERSSLAQLNNFVLNWLRAQLDKSKASYRDLLKDYEHALELYNDTRVENMRLRDKVAMLERVLVDRTRAESNLSSDCFSMH